jgi:predicted transposase/invertase (TIGR01784 family)
MSRKKFKDLNLKDAFLFGAALSDEETCRMILELVLGKKISHVKVHTEHTFLYSSDYRMVRLDVYASDDVQVSYDMEMQNKNEKNLPKRSRYHLAEMDLNSLRPGESFEDLKPSFVVFICTFDPFGYGLYRYTFEPACKERDFLLGDETCRIFLNTKGQNPDEVPPELVTFLKYVEDSSAECAAQTKDERIAKIHDNITRLKKSREWEAHYMTLEEYLHQEAQDWAQEIAQDMAKDMAQDIAKDMAKDMARDMQNRFIQLVSSMAADGLTDQIPNLQKNPDYLEEMYKKYDL